MTLARSRRPVDPESRGQGGDTKKAGAKSDKRMTALRSEGRPGRETGARPNCGRDAPPIALISAQSRAVQAAFRALNNANARETSFLTDEDWRELVAGAFAATCATGAAAPLIALDQVMCSRATTQRPPPLRRNPTGAVTSRQRVLDRPLVRATGVSALRDVVRPRRRAVSPHRRGPRVFRPRERLASIISLPRPGLDRQRLGPTAPARRPTGLQPVLATAFVARGTRRISATLAVPDTRIRSEIGARRRAF